MVWVFMAVAAFAAALAVYLESIWLCGVSLLAIVAAVWEGRSRGMWLAYEFEDSDSGSSSYSSSDAGSDGGDD